MSIYKDHHAPPHYDNFGMHLNVDRADKRNANFHLEDMNRSMRLIMDNNGEVDGYGYPMMPKGPTVNPMMPGLTQEDTSSFMARHPRDTYIVCGLLTLGYVGTALFWLRRGAHMI